MNHKQAEKYAGPLLNSLYEIEGVKCERKYPKVDNETNTLLAEPTPLDIYDSIADKILPRNEYFGPGKSFDPDNITWRIKLLACYMMQKKGINYNDYCKNKPSDYVNRNFTIEDLENLAEDPVNAPQKDGRLKQIKFGRPGFRNIHKRSETESITEKTKQK